VFWVKFQDASGKTMYLHKAYLKSVIPLKQADALRWMLEEIGI